MFLKLRKKPQHAEQSYQYIAMMESICCEIAVSATLAFNGLISHSIIFSDIKHKNIILTMWKRKVKKLQLQTSLGNRKNRCREKENLLVREAYFRIAWPKRGELLLNVFVNWSNKSKKKNSNLKLNRVSCNYLLCSLVRYVT